MHRFTFAVLLLPIAAAATALPVRVDAERARLEKECGTVEDPDGDCTFRADLGRLSIVIPGTPHALSAEIGKMNGPRVLREIDGDFRVQVKVAGALPADPRCEMPGRWAFYGAGLLVLQDEKNYVRSNGCACTSYRRGSGVATQALSYAPAALLRDVGRTRTGRSTKRSPPGSGWCAGGRLSPRRTCRMARAGKSCPRCRSTSTPSFVSASTPPRIRKQA